MTDDRAAGYVTDVGYTPGYHPELNPLNTRPAFLRAGLAAPAIATACELGFGQGVSLAVHAAAGPARWWGCDLLPAHVEFARGLDAASGAGAVLAAATFAEFAARDDLPAFDFIGLHGVLSWVSAENRGLVARFIARRLAPGGVVYTGCNALPGWTEMLPLRRLLVEHAATAPAGQGTVGRIDAALDFAARVLEENPLALRGLPGAAGRFARLRDADRRYLAHEYFNRDWAPLHFDELADLMATAGLRHACAARLLDQLDALNLSAGQRALLAAIPEPRLREAVRDLLTNAQVRRDYWVRAPAPLAGPALQDAWHATRVALVTPRDDVPERVTGPLGGLSLAEPAHRAVLDALAAGGTATLGALAAATDGAVDAAFELAALGHVAVAQAPDQVDACAARTRRLNRRLAAEPDVAVRASAVTGGGVFAGTPTPLLAALHAD